MSDDLDPAPAPEPSPPVGGTIRLARAALDAPPPGENAEAASRRHVEVLMQDAALSPRLLREAAAPLPRRPWWQRWQFWKR